MAITESVADYLEAIMVLQREKGYVRAVDIANYFGYSRPTVSQTLKSFRQKGYVEVDEDSFVKLTELSAKKEETQQALEAAEERWLYLTDLHERIEAQKNG